MRAHHGRAWHPIPELENSLVPRETLALPQNLKPWSITTVREKPIKIGAKIVRHGRYVTFQMADRMAEVAVPGNLFQEILRLIDELRSRPPARC